MNFLMVENNPLPVVGVSSSTSECLRLVRDGRLARVGFGCWDALRILSLIVLAVTCKAVSEKGNKKRANTGRDRGNHYGCTVETTDLSKRSVGNEYKQVVLAVSNALTFKMGESTGCICVQRSNTGEFSTNIWMHSRSRFTYISGSGNNSWLYFHLYH